MGIFKKRAEEIQETQTAADDSLLKAMLYGQGGITRKKAMEIPTICACVTLIANKISSLPIKLYENDGDSVTEITNDNRVKMLNGDTGDTLNSTEMIRNWVFDYFLGKGAYTYIHKDLKGNFIGLFYVSEENINVQFNNKPIFKDYTINVQGEQFYPHNFIKILRNSKGNGKGVSIIDESALPLSVAYETLVFEDKLIKKGGNKKGFLKSKSRLSDTAMDSIKKAWKELYSGNTDNMVILNEGMDFSESSNTSVEMQLNERKSSTNADICAIFSVPPEILTGKASDDAKTLFTENSIMPVVNAIESALDSDLLLETEKGSRYFAFDTRELTRGSIEKRYAAYGYGIEKNFLQVDEVRKFEDLPELGFNYIKLGLQDVLLNPATGEIYTPNTNAKENLFGTNDNNVIKDETEDFPNSENVVEEVENIADKRLNGAQTQSLIAVLSQYADGKLTSGQAVNIISVAIGISKEKAIEIIEGTNIRATLTLT